MVCTYVIQREIRERGPGRASATHLYNVNTSRIYRYIGSFFLYIYTWGYVTKVAYLSASPPAPIDLPTYHCGLVLRSKIILLVRNLSTVSCTILVGMFLKSCTRGVSLCLATRITCFGTRTQTEHNEESRPFTTLRN